MKSADNSMSTSCAKECFESTSYIFRPGLILCHKRIKLAAGFAVLLLIVGFLDSCWYISRSIAKQHLDFLKFSASGVDAGSNAADGSRTPNSSSSDSEGSGEVCDFSKGKWVADMTPPPYTNNTCKYIHPSQDCMKNGRPDRGYLYWRWQPISCELRRFDAQLFLESMKQKKMTFIGDSIARNHMQSLLCALAQVEDPHNVYFDVKEKEASWEFVSYKFTLSNLWSPFLANHSFVENVYHIHLDMPDMMWSSRINDYDIAILSTGYWYFRPSIYYMNNTILGTNPHSGVNLTIFDKVPAMKVAWETTLNHMINKYNGIIIMRTITVPHFEGADWFNGGYCNKTMPFFDPLMQEPLPWMTDAISRAQIQEFRKAMDRIRASKYDLQKLRLLNVTYSSFLRPDGHPNSFRIMTAFEPRNDCLHWCLPGPIDMWNQILLHILLS
ncbi:hypothetical protein KP509_28G038000 [Ceratopteris richardii]|uniref:Trichome birefringence-like N-terminal domain-containing protein n=1 Tax=Ceratopteris richardii TaxID=49495 RepID=A0A8T2RBB7_CERRI|nr:hypothetical protein KP509_28G038000 [Ceratopteris richardii]